MEINTKVLPEDYDRYSINNTEEYRNELSYCVNYNDLNAIKKFIQKYNFGINHVLCHEMCVSYSSHWTMLQYMCRPNKRRHYFFDCSCDSDIYFTKCIIDTTWHNNYKKYNKLRYDVAIWLINNGANIAYHMRNTPTCITIAWYHNDIKMLQILLSKVYMCRNERLYPYIVIAYSMLDIKNKNKFYRSQKKLVQFIILHCFNFKTIDFAKYKDTVTLKHSELNKLLHRPINTNYMSLHNSANKTIKTYCNLFTSQLILYRNQNISLHLCIQLIENKYKILHVCNIPCLQDMLYVQNATDRKPVLILKFKHIEPSLLTKNQDFFY